MDENYMRAFQVQRNLYVGFDTLDQIINQKVNFYDGMMYHTSN